MKNTHEDSFWRELWNSIKFCIESKNRKFSLNTYLDIVGEYTDKQIKSAEAEGMTYLGGECQITNLRDTNAYDFEIKMFFENSKGENIVKEAKRNLPKDKFVSETDCEVGKKIKFEIQRPNN